MGSYNSMNEEERRVHREYEQLQFAIAVLLDGIGLVFDGARGFNKDDSSNEDEKQQNDEKYKKIKEDMITHFLNNKNIDSYMALITEYLHGINKKFKECNNQKTQTEEIMQDTQRYVGQLGKCINVFVALSRSEQCHSMLFKYSIHTVLVSLIGVCRNWKNHRVDKCRIMLQIIKNNILVYFDQIGVDAKFDDLFSTDFDNNVDNMKATKLPYFWIFICDVFADEYKGRPSAHNLSQFAHFKSCSIRLLYRWSCRRVDATKPLNEQMPITKATQEEMDKYKATYVGQKKISFIMELMIKKYFEKFLDWLSYNDLQVLANTPLVVRQMIIYAINIGKERPQS